ncbi:UNVERIFIED_CONTAM: hypothetical protein K2H54_059513 [Gekko kuhli]
MMSGGEEESIPTMTEMAATTPVTETPVTPVALIMGAPVTHAPYLPGQPFPVFYILSGFSQQGVKTFQGRMLLNPYPSFPLIPPAQSYGRSWRSERLRDKARNNIVYLNCLRTGKCHWVRDPEEAETLIGESKCPSTLKT